MSLTLKLEPTLEQQLREQAARRGLEPGTYAVEAIQERIRLDSRPPARLGREESELLSQIGAGLPELTWGRYDHLIAKRRDESLTSEEHEELIRLTNLIEEDHARRIAALGKLARLRNVPLQALALQLGITPRRRGTEHE